MDDQRIYTVTIIENIGVPISFTIKRRKVIMILLLLVFVACLFVWSSFAYLQEKTKNQKLNRELAQASEQVTSMKNYMSRIDRKLYEASPGTGKEAGSVKQSLLEQPEFSTEGDWVSSRTGLSLDELREGKMVELADFEAEMKGDVLTLSARLKNSSNPDQPVGGYLFITLVNEDASPPLYKSATGGKLGANGFPISYKAGRQYSIYSKSSKARVSLRVDLNEPNEFYTSAMIFLYTYKGSLLSKQQIPLDKKIFLED